MKIACVTPPSRFDYVEAIERLSRQYPRVTPQFTRYVPESGTFPTVSACDGVLVTGSSAHVYDDDPWVERTIDLVRRAIAEHVPLLGVCFGHQLLATAFGGTVEPLSEREVGFRQIRLSVAGERNPLFDGLGQEFPAFAWHRDAVTTCPTGATVLATGDSGVQSLVVDGANAFGIQFHPEFTRGMRRVVCQDRACSRNQRDAVVRVPERGRVSRNVYDNFLRIATDHSSRGP